MIAELKGLGRRGLAVETDVAAKKDAERMVRECLENFGRVDILVNNAGAGSLGLLVNQTEEDWEKPMQVNLKGTFLCSQAAAKEMIPRKQRADRQHLLHFRENQGRSLSAPTALPSSESSG